MGILGSVTTERQAGLDALKDTVFPSCRRLRCMDFCFCFFLSTMPYSLTFNVSYALKGPASGHKVYKVSLVPQASASNAPPTLFYQHFLSATTVRLLRAEGNVFATVGPRDKPAPFCVGAIVGVNNPATTVHQLARGRPIASDGSNTSFSLANAPGINPVLKGVMEPGEHPALHVAVAAGYDASSLDVAIVSMAIEVEFDGVSDAVAYDQALPDMK